VITINLSGRRRRLFMRMYHLSCGDSTRGPVGMCGAVLARNKRHALLLLRRALEDATGAFGEVPIRTAEPGVEYINVYVVAPNIRIKEIAESV
jgi:hypothetical protein